MCTCSLVRINGNLSKKSFRQRTSLIMTCSLYGNVLSVSLLMSSLLRWSFGKPLWSYNSLWYLVQVKASSPSGRTSRKYFTSKHVFLIVISFSSSWSIFIFPYIFLSIIFGISWLCLNRWFLKYDSAQEYHNPWASEWLQSSETKDGNLFRAPVKILS